MINMKRKAQAIPVMPTTYSTTKTNTSTLFIHGNNTHFVQSLSLLSIKINKQIKQILTYPLKYISMMFIPSIWNVHAKYCGNQRINRDAYSSRIQKELQLQQNRKKKKKKDQQIMQHLWFQTIKYLFEYCSRKLDPSSLGTSPEWADFDDCQAATKKKKPKSSRHIKKIHTYATTIIIPN